MPRRVLILQPENGQQLSKVAGVAVPQLYMRVTGAQLEQPVRLLRGYDRIQLAPGETKHIEFKLGFDELANLRHAPATDPRAFAV